MIDINTQLTVFKDSIDHSAKAATFSRDSFTVRLDVANYLYVGYKKPINAFYLNLDAGVSPADGVGILEYWNGSAWVNVTNLSEDTLGLKRSGYLSWDRDLLGQSETAVDGVTLYWYRLSTTTLVKDVVIQGINLVFSDDYELYVEDDKMPSADYLGNKPSHILSHVAARNEILQFFKGKDYVKVVNGLKQDINAWDILDIFEVQQAATYLACHKIYLGLSDQPTDIMAAKAAQYYAKYEKMMDVASLSLDLNDDGKLNSNENKNAMSARYMTR